MSVDSKERVWTLRNRLLSLLKTKLDEKGQYKTLEELTSIKATHWRDFAAGKQRPTAEMIEAAGRLWPEHAFWLITGITDAEHGHIAPKNGNFPLTTEKQNQASPFFHKSMELVDLCIDAFNGDADFRDPDILLHFLLTGAHRSTHQLISDKSHIERIIQARRELRELQIARNLEFDIKEVQPHETDEETSIRLPERFAKLKTVKPLAGSSIEDLEALLEAEKERQARNKRIEKRLLQVRNVD